MANKVNVTEEQFIDALRNTKEDVISIVYEVPAKMRKDGNPFYRKEGRKFVPVNEVTKRAIDSYAFGYNYTELCNKAIQDSRRDGQAGDYQTAPTNRQEIVKDKVCQITSKDGETTKYLILYPVQYAKGDPFLPEHQSVYLVDGVPATQEQLDTIDEFLQLSYSGPSDKQTKAGIEDYEQVRQQILKISNIIAATVGSTPSAVTYVLKNVSGGNYF